MTAAILYSTARLNTCGACVVGERVSRSVQSAAAQHLLQKLKSQLTVTAQSKSHSRTMVIAAAGDVLGLSMGVDIEWRKPDRPFSALLEAFTGPDLRAVSMEEFYRTWTFGEAYFKAFKCLPTGDLLREVCDRPPSAEIVTLSDGTSMFGYLAEVQFQISLVWRTGDGKPFNLRFISDN